MIFNSYGFVLLFLPAALAVFHFANARKGAAGAVSSLLFFSLLFYALWDVRYLALLLASTTANYLAGRHIQIRLEAGQGRAAGAILALGVAANLAVLAGFKYLAFATASLNAAFGIQLPLPEILLPLGISFFTFEQLAYLVDIHRGSPAERSLPRYTLFVVFFPRLVAGPVLRYSEIGPQMPQEKPFRASSGDLAVGLTLFSIGLAKKAFLADSIAPYANNAFNEVALGGQPDLLLAWGGVLAYSLQLYFDFSGYSDMAIGTARCFGLRFPANFASPYQATSIIEFWRRWHMTLSRFLRDYLYVPLGGNRRGTLRRHVNLMLTMILGGLWHGANWTFVAWGALHGGYLIINHVWLRLTSSHPRLRSALTSCPGQLGGWALTMVAVAVGWVFFRSPDLAAAERMLAGMAGANGMTLPAGLLDRLPILQSLGFTGSDASGSRFIATWLWCLLLGLIAVALPNSQQILADATPVLEDVRQRGSRLRWRMSRRWSFAMAALLLIGLMSISRGGEFLYWQF
ncbi:MBOAT family O-acyltransferase [Pseudoroseomonas ludipueritiae]|uniref:Probable alginate O-acetylase AlgI n=1 Tax=Pseudoroseomonas ludipueritiae TaxID=198093 RepID=A0ABR7R7F7_9PROT|nr:MBOAT family O-acyltransferase [Pseudoroseomonas ludipueritiae]MBC9177729.1 MBOAT family protein [Pseudoroseomonas ludipueritiae]